MYTIYANEEFESYFGKIKKGDELETVMIEEEKEFIRYAYEKYGPYGENIKIKWRKTDDK